MLNLIVVKLPILWNVISNDEKTGICTKCKKWATVIKYTNRECLKKKNKYSAIKTNLQW